MDKKIVHIGIDNYDTPQGGCTTHFSIHLIRKLLKRKIEFIDYPNLIRLNPNIPWKTRGNGAIALRLIVYNDVNDLVELLRQESQEYLSELKEFKYRQPGLAVYIGESVPREYKWLYKKALTDIVTLDVALKIADKNNTIILTSRQNRGLIGALAAIGGLQNTHEDYTYELLAYRSKEYTGLRDRLIDYESVRNVELKYHNYLFNNYDFEYNKPVLTPHGPDPVLLGLRGDDPKILVKAFQELRIEEPIDAWCIFRTNQGTDAHLVKRDIGKLRPYQTGLIEGVVYTKPKTLLGGHVKLYLEDSTGIIPVYFYEPTKKLRKIALQLIPGDKVRISGGVRPPSPSHPELSFNAEKLEIVELIEYIKRNPKCPRCGKTMKSAGKGRGYKCPKCKYYDPKIGKVYVKITRIIKPGVYTPPISSMHHLTKPPVRYGRENTGKKVTLIKKWCSIL